MKPSCQRISCGTFGQVSRITLGSVSRAIECRTELAVESEYRVSAIRIVQCTISRRVCHYESLARSSTANDAGVTLVTLQKLKRLNLFRRETLKAC